MLIILLFHSILIWITNCQSVLSGKIYNYEASGAVKSRIFFSNLTKNAVLQRFDISKYPVDKDLGIGMLLELPKNCSCPDLREIHSVLTKDGQLKFERADLLGSSEYTDLGLAGYLAPFPGYCNSDAIELIEFYSPILKEFRYDTMNNVWNYYADFQNFYRPVRVLGYAYYSTNGVWMSGSPPYVRSGLDSPVYKALSARFEVVRTLTNSTNAKIYAVNFTLIDSLISNGWTLNPQTIYGPLSSQNDILEIQEKCGVLQKCVDTFNATSGLYTPKNSVTQNLEGLEIVGDCGYFLSSSSCFSSAVQYYSYSPSYSPNTVNFANYNDNSGSNNSVGFVYPYLFSFLKI